MPPTQNRVSTLKPGRIIGSAVSGGVANTDDVFWRVVATAASIHVFPEEPMDNWMYITNISTVTSSILNQIFATEGIAPFIGVSKGIPAPVF